MFEKASQIKLRFKTHVGLISVEDLWDMSLPNLDTLAKALKKELNDKESFIDSSITDEAAQLRFDIVLHVINTKLEQRERFKAQKERDERRRVLLDIINSKQTEELRNKSIEELAKELEELTKELEKL